MTTSSLLEQRKKIFLEEKSARKINWAGVLGNTGLYILLSMLVILIIFPVLYAFLGSFKTNAEVTLGGTIFPQKWMVENYVTAWKQANFAVYTMNSLIICLSTVVLALFISSSAGYCLARRNFPGKKILNAAYLSTIFISVGALIYKPLFMVMVHLHLQNSLLAIILIQVGGQATNVFLISRFLAEIPIELDESAQIDGCTFFRTFWNIILPLLKPVLGVVGLFMFRLSWNDYVLPSIFTMARPDLRPLTVGVVALKYGANAAAEWHLMLAGAMFALFPMIIIYLIANKQFLNGLTAGAVKG